jgi:hypothetical protein
VDVVCVAALLLLSAVRAAVPGAITDCQRAGIAVRMITGDNAATAAAIAAECGILPAPLLQQVEEALAARSRSGISSAAYNAQLAQLLAELPLPEALQKQADENAQQQQQQPGWLNSFLHGLSGSAGGADPAAGLALMRSVVSSSGGKVDCRQCLLHVQQAACWLHVQQVACAAI